MESITVAIIVYECSVLLIAGSLYPPHRSVAMRMSQARDSSPSLAARPTRDTHTLSVIAHQLQTPVAVLTGEIELLCVYQDHPAEYCAIQRSLKKITQCIDTYLRLARVRHHDSHHAFQWCNVSNLVATQVEYLETMAQTQGVSITASIEAGLSGLAHPTLLEELILTIGHNAITYRALDRDPVIHIVLVCQNDYLVFQCIDNGLGIPPNDLPHVCEEFYRSQYTESCPGTGLGLAIAKHIAELHCGTLTLESTQGVGTTCTVMFPIRR